MLNNFDNIKYRGKVIDTGIIIGMRKYRWSLKRKYQPLFAKNGEYCSVLSDHRQNFTVYIPKSLLKVNEVYTVSDCGNVYKFRIIKINKHSYESKTISFKLKPVKPIVIDEPAPWEL